MTNTTVDSEPLLLKTDAPGRVRTPAARREQLLDEFEDGGTSGAKFAELVGVKYQTFASWVQQRRRHRKAAAKSQNQVFGFHSALARSSAGQDHQTDQRWRRHFAGASAGRSEPGDFLRSTHPAGRGLGAGTGKIPCLKMAGGYVQIDETPFQFLAPHGQTKQGYLWTAYRWETSRATGASARSGDEPSTALLRGRPCGG